MYEVIKERIKNDECLICGKKLGKNIIVIEHMKAGVGYICDTHPVQGEILKEE